MGASPWPKEDDGGRGHGRVKGGGRKELGAFLGRGLSVGGREGGGARKGPKIDLPRKRLRSRSFAASVPSCVHTWRKLKKRGKGGRHLGNGKEYGEQDGFFVWESLPAIGCGSQKKKIRNHALEGTEQMAVDIGNQVFYIRKPKGPKGVRKKYKSTWLQEEIYIPYKHTVCFVALGSPFLCLVS